MGFLDFIEEVAKACEKTSFSPDDARRLYDENL